MNTPAATDAAATPPRLLRRVAAPPDLAALGVGLVFAWAAWRPTLLPRTAVVQGALSALALLIGYGLAGLVLVATRPLRERAALTVGAPNSKVASWATPARYAVAAGAVGVVVIGPWRWLAWQNTQRDLVSMDRVGPGAALGALAVALVLSAVILAVARVVVHLVALLDRLLGARVGPWVAHGITAIVVVALVAGLTNRVVIDGVIGGTQAAFGEGNGDTEPGIDPPTSPLRSGGPGSAVPWDTLGLRGRTFVATATTTAEIAAQLPPGSDATPMEPIRVYAGLDSAPDADGRAQVALADLERTGAFDRSVLVLTTVTGTGWINPTAARAVELLWHGDSAIVGIQYSYLPSWISTLLDEGKAEAAAVALNRAVVDRWRQLPPDQRPHLVVLGESLGSYGSEAATAGATTDESLTNATAGADGVLWVAPTNDNPVWRQLTATRQPASPLWRPTIDDPRATFTTQPDQLPTAAADQAPVVRWLQHPSDPVTWWDVPTMWSRPAWMTQPRDGTDLSRDTSWFPIVTWLQTTADLAAGFSTAPGHGHNFNHSWAAAFASVAAPDGWTAADTTRLDDYLLTHPDGPGS